MLDRKAPTEFYRDLEYSETHPLKVGAIVTVLRLKVFGRPFIEGRATIVAPVDGVPNFYKVMFVGEKIVRERYAHAEHQADPHASVAAMLDLWKASMTPEILEEFFPGDL